jgi:hypothetical protein
MKNTNTSINKILAAIIYGFILLMVIVWILVICYSERCEDNNKDQMNTIRYPKIENLKDSMKIFIKFIGTKHPDIAYNVAQHESGFNSGLTRQNNNYFGMMNPGLRRPTTCINYNTQDRWAKYNSWKDSAIDFYLLQLVVRADTMNEMEYLSYLERSYGCEPGYKNYVN